MTSFHQQLDETLVRAAESLRLAQAIRRQLAASRSGPESLWRTPM